MFKTLLFSVLIALVLGAPPNNYKIDEGSPANIADYPWQVYIQIAEKIYNEDYFDLFEGFLVTPSWVLTTAIAVVSYEDTDGDGVVSIRAGSNFTDRGGEVYGISKYVVHPGFNWTFFDNNIGLFKLSTPVNASIARPGPLPEAGESIPDNASFIVTGYNRTELDAGTLLQTTIPTFDYDTCKAQYKDVYGDNTIISVNTFCAGKNGPKNCFGHGGGPAHLDGKIVGIRSDKGCDPLGLPAVLTKVSQYINWINDNVQE